MFDVVIIYAFDRLARKQVHQAVIIEDLRQQGVSVESVTEKFDESAVGQFMSNADKSKVEARLREIEKKLIERIVDLGQIDSQLAEITQEMQNCARGIVKAKDEYTIELLTTENEKHAAARAELEKLRAELSEKANNIELIRSKLDRFRKNGIVRPHL